MKKFKRLPPILFPVWLLLFLIDNAYKFFLWLIGYWYCKDCGKRYGLTDDKHLTIYTKDYFIGGKFYTRFRKKHICTACKGNQSQQ